MSWEPIFAAGILGACIGGAMALGWIACLWWESHRRAAWVRGIRRMWGMQ